MHFAIVRTRHAMHFAIVNGCHGMHLMSFVRSYLSSYVFFMFLLKKIKLQKQLSGRTSLLCGFVVPILDGWTGLSYAHNLIWKPQLRSYVTGRFGIKLPSLQHCC